MKKILFYSAFSLLLINFSACSGDDDDNTGGNQNEDVDCTSSLSVNQAVADEVDAISVASAAYASDPSSTNCNNFEEALQNYVEVLKSLLACAEMAGEGASFQIALELAEASAGSLTC